MDNDHARTGPTRRRRRLSDQETEERMLEAALATVNRVGLTVSLEHISLEDVIREAGVSRSAVYRRWPYKDMFFSDLLRAIAKAATPSEVPEAGPTRESVGAVLREHQDSLRTPEGRHAVVVEMLRVGNLADLDALAKSTAWRTYVGLQATYLSLDDGELRDEIGASLAESERALVRRTATSFGYWMSLMGYRVKLGLAADAETVVALAMPLVRGAIIMGPATPQITRESLQSDPFGVSAEASWSPVAIAMTSIVLSYVEPDPDIEWNDERIERVRQELSGGEQVGSRRSVE